MQIKKVLQKKEHVIYRITPGSIAEELELEPGDVVLSINGQEIRDIFDYQYLTNDEYLLMLVRKENGEEWELEIEKDFSEDLGIDFENGLMDDYRSCYNKCIFCFIDQMPPGMRDTLYFKDDDSRLSFLQGNYVTLTNMTEEDVERIITYHMSPINVSVHTTNPKLRCKMLGNRFAGQALEKMERFAKAGIEMNGQIVLCRGINDGKELDRSIQDLMKYIPHMESLSVVPVGLTKYREGLYPLEAFTKEDALAVIEQIHHWQDVCLERYGIHFVHAADEWYLLAQQEFPEEERYDGYIQLENGVGMMRLLQEEFMECLNNAHNDDMHKTNVQKRLVTIATGKAAGTLVKKLAEAFEMKCPHTRVQVVIIENKFFGEQITVSGLLTGQDIVAQLQGRELGEYLLLPCNLLRSGERVFLDDMTLEQVESALQVPVNIVKSSGQSLFEALCGT